MRCGRERQQSGCAAEDGDQCEKAKTENRPVPREAAARIDGSDRAEWRQGGQGDGNDNSQDRSERDRRLKPDQSVEDGVGRIRAQGPEDPQVLAVGAQPARHELGGDEHGGEKGDRSEHPQGDGDRLQRAVRLGDDRCQGMVGDLGAAWGRRRRSRARRGVQWPLLPMS